MGALTRDQKQVQATLSPYDLLICIGADVLQMSVWSEVEPLPNGMPIVQIGLRDWEMGKNYPAEIALRSDVGTTLRALVPIVQDQMTSARQETAIEGLKQLATNNWSSRREAMCVKTIGLENSTPINPDWLMLQIAELLPENAIVVDEGLTGAKNLLGFLPLRDRYSYFGMVSGGIGWGIAAAVGVQLAQPDRPVVAVLGDGSSLYSPQALWSAAHLNLPITFVMLNNQGYRILKERLIAFHDDDRFIGMDFDTPTIDLAGLARSLGVEAETVANPKDFEQALNTALKDARPRLIEVMVEPGPQRPGKN
jgi:benzoylformate decarboxylase